MLMRIFLSFFIVIPFSSLALAKVNPVDQDVSQTDPGQAAIHQHDKISIDGLRALCEEYEKNPQTKPFEKIFTCSGSDSTWVRRESSKLIENSAVISGRTEYTKSAGAPATPGSCISVDAAGTRIPCDVWHKVSARADAVTIYLNSCSEIRADVINQACHEKMQRVCGGTHEQFDFSGPVQQTSGTCTLEVTQTINTCDYYQGLPSQDDRRQQAPSQGKCGKSVSFDIKGS